MTHTTHIAARMIRAPGANPLDLARQVFRPCCSCGWRGDERPDIESRTERLLRADDDARAHIETQAHT